MIWCTNFKSKHITKQLDQIAKRPKFVWAWRKLNKVWKLNKIQNTKLKNVEITENNLQKWHNSADQNYFPPGDQNFFPQLLSRLRQDKNSTCIVHGQNSADQNYFPPRDQNFFPPGDQNFFHIWNKWPKLFKRTKFEAKIWQIKNFKDNQKARKAVATFMRWRESPRSNLPYRKGGTNFFPEQMKQPVYYTWTTTPEEREKIQPPRRREGEDSTNHSGR